MSVAGFLRKLDVSSNEMCSVDLIRLVKTLVAYFYRISANTYPI